MMMSMQIGHVSGSTLQIDWYATFFFFYRLFFKACLNLSDSLKTTYFSMTYFCGST